VCHSTERERASIIYPKSFMMFAEQLESFIETYPASRYSVLF